MIWVANWVSEHIDQAGETSISQIVPRSCSRPAGWGGSADVLEARVNGLTLGRCDVRASV